MANNIQTVYQRLEKMFGSNGYGQPTDYTKKVNSYGVNGNNVIFRTKDKEEYEKKKLELRQQHKMSRMWKKASYDIANNSLAGLTDVKLMYRDADLMDGFPEIGAALDIYMEEACFMPNNGMLVNVSSKSERIKSILQDLLVNRLSINTVLPMVCRSTCKYGNTFMLLNFSTDNGIIGWKQLPVYEMERYENGMSNPYMAGFSASARNDMDVDDSTKFVWVGSSEYTPYRNWQIAHFRMLYDSIYLPYGVSILNKARRHFRMLSMMEDMMLLYRLERSVERRVFKINVGAIDEQDVPAYMDQIANEFKRTPIVDPMTGQLDLRKSILNVMDDFFIPVRDDSAPNPIETLQAAQNMSALDDIKYVQNKVFTALRVPKPFLNFEETAGEGKNLSLLDVRFTRTVNRVQNMMLMELNKICMEHLMLLGFTDDLTNFTLTMNNPSSQAEMMEIENMAKKVQTAKDAISDAGNGIPLFSVTRAWKEIMGWSEKEIEDNLEELRLEKALSAELENTAMIIKRTGLFDPVDNIYGEPGADYQQMQQGGPDDEMGGAPGGGFGGGFDMGGGDLDLGGMPEEGDMAGAEGEMGMDAAADEEAGLSGDNGGGESDFGGPVENLMTRKLKNLITEQQTLQNKLLDKSKKYTELLKAKRNEKALEEEKKMAAIPLFDKTFMVNEELNSIFHKLNQPPTN